MITLTTCWGQSGRGNRIFKPLATSRCFSLRRTSPCPLSMIYSRLTPISPWWSMFLCIAQSKNSWNVFDQNLHVRSSPYPEQHIALPLLVGQVDIVECLLPVLIRTEPILQHLLGVVGGELLLGYHVDTLTVNVVECLIKLFKENWKHRTSILSTW